MANKETVDKVKSLLEGHCYAPLKEAAEKWLAEVDEFMEKNDAKAEELGAKLNDVTDKLSAKADEAVAKINESGIIDKVSSKASDAAAKISETEAFEKVSAKANEAAAKLAESEFIEKLKEGIPTVDEMIELFGSEEGRKKFGDEMAGKIKAHAEGLKEKGEKFCDCEACQKAKAILKDLGEKLD